MKRLWAVAAAIAALTLLLISCGGEEKEPAPPKHERSRDVMGTILTVTVYGLPDAEAEEAIEAVFAEMDRLNSLMSNWDPESGLSRLNRAAAEDWAAADPEILGLILEAKHYSALSGGAFDVTAGPLVRLWGFFRKNERRPPDRPAIDEALAQIGYEGIEVDREQGNVRFAKPGMEIDFGGIAKGYAADRGAQILLESGVDSGLVNLGGNIIAVGAPPGRERWRVSVRDPRSSDAMLGVLEIGEVGVASSGQYERFFVHEGRRYGHIIDPRSGNPVEGMLGTTVVAPDGLTADILSTSVFVLGPEAGIELIRSQRGVLAIVAVPEGEDGMLLRISSDLRPHFELDPNAKGVRIKEF